jgi:hypothetical protein
MHHPLKKWYCDKSANGLAATSRATLALSASVQLAMYAPIPQGKGEKIKYLINFVIR